MIIFHYADLVTDIMFTIHIYKNSFIYENQHMFVMFIVMSYCLLFERIE